MPGQNILIVFFGILALTFSGCAQTPVPAPATEPTFEPDFSKARVGKIEASGTEFADVVQQIREASLWNIVVDWKALKASRVTKSLPVTVELSNLSLREALDKLLANVGGRHVALTYDVDENGITISTVAEQSKWVTTKVYDIKAHMKDLADIKRRVSGIDPLSWKSAGADGEGAIDDFNGQLIITATPEIHERIAADLHEILPPAK